MPEATLDTAGGQRKWRPMRTLGPVATGFRYLNLALILPNTILSTKQNVSEIKALESRMKDYSIHVQK